MLEHLRAYGGDVCPHCQKQIESSETALRPLVQHKDQTLASISIILGAIALLFYPVVFMALGVINGATAVSMGQDRGIVGIGLSIIFGLSGVVLSIVFLFSIF